MAGIYFIVLSGMFCLDFKLKYDLLSHFLINTAQLDQSQSNGMIGLLLLQTYLLKIFVFVYNVIMIVVSLT